MFLDMTNNIFYEKSTGEKVQILNEDANFYVLDNSVRIKKDIFLKKYEQREEINPDIFFQQPVNDPLLNIAKQLKNLDTTNLKDSGNDGTKVKYTPPITIADSSMSESQIKQKQTEEIIKLDPEQRKTMLEEWRKTHPGAQIPEIQEKNWEEIDNQKFLHGDKPVQKLPEIKTDPLEMMFKMFKNNFPVKFKLEIEENIPNPHFIEIVQENVEADAVEYYANKILDNLLKDPSKLKTEIYNQLKNIMTKGTKNKNIKK
jgi:hypothetical protein